MPITTFDPMGAWTFSISIGFDLTFFFGGCSGSIGISIDDDWDIAIQTSYSTPMTGHIGLVDASVGVSVQITDADNVSDLNGVSSYAGASGGEGWYVGADLVYNGVAAFDRSNGNEYPNGIAFNFGVGVGVDMHMRQTVTETLWSTEQNKENSIEQTEQSVLQSFVDYSCDIHPDHSHCHCLLPCRKAQLVSRTTFVYPCYVDRLVSAGFCIYSDSNMEETLLMVFGRGAKVA